MDDRPIRYENPFVDPPEQRTPARRLRGRLALPVTVWTAGSADEPFGLTVSSMVVADGEPPVLAGLVGETTDLYAAAIETGAFVVHVLPENEERTGEIFAGLRPSPGGPFAGRAVEQSDWGPVLKDFGTRAFCKLQQTLDAGYQKLVTARVERIDVSDEEADPLVYFRGRFRRLAPDVRRPSS